MLLGFYSTAEAENWDDETVLAASINSPWLFRILVDRYEAAFLRKVRTVIYNPLDAEEVVQDTFTKIYVSADKYEPQSGAKFSSWAYRILLNTAFTRYQKLVKEKQRFVAINPELEQTFGARTEHSGFAEQRDSIERVLDKVPEHFAIVLRLHYLERWSHQDIAAEMEEQVGAVKARIHRAKAAFRKEAKDNEADLLAD